MDQEFMTYCPRCGNMAYWSTESVCFFCFLERIPTNTKITDFEQLTASEKDSWRSETMSKIVVKNPQFDYAARKDMEVAANIRFREFVDSQIGHHTQTHCPHCQSTSFQMVPRKWSLMTGLMTNKVDRVCTNCKKRF